MGSLEVHCCPESTLTYFVLFHTGVYTNSYDAALNVRNGFPVFSTVIEANNITKNEDRFAAFKLTDEDKQELHRLARDPRIGIYPPPS
jgi:DNA replicative helicase MCM subunit Mcm2 (Cdc46/Mcm family)